MSGTNENVDPTAPLIAVAWPKDDYLAALKQAGAEIRLIGPESYPLPEALDGCDGLLLTGGSDVDPARYGESDRHPTTQPDPVRDDYEIALAKSALDRNLPLLAICRGTQVLNVAAGGSLVQDIPSQVPNALIHSIKPSPDSTVHDVEVTPQSRLAMLMKDRLDAESRVPVNSRHHQSVETVAPDFQVSATAPDGIIEAIEKPSAAFCVGVQWHPENFWRTGEFSSLFAGLIDAARRRKRG